MTMQTSRLALAGALILCLGLAGPASADMHSVVAPQKQTFDLSQMPSGKYALDKSHTSVVFKVSHLGYSAYVGRFNVVDATLDFNAKEPAKSKLEVTIDAKSIDTNHKELEEKLRGPDWFDTQNHGTITFRSKSIEQTSDRAGKVTGTLSLLGNPRPTTLDVTFNGFAPSPLSGTPTLGFSATGTINRTEFGMTKFAPMVGDTVALEIEAEFVQPKP